MTAPKALLICSLIFVLMLVVNPLIPISASLARQSQPTNVPQGFTILPVVPLTIATVSASPEPVVGQVVTLTVEIKPMRGEPEPIGAHTMRQMEVAVYPAHPVRLYSQLPARKGGPHLHSTSISDLTRSQLVHPSQP